MIDIGRRITRIRIIITSTQIAFAMLLVACGYPALPQLSGGDAGGDAVTGDPDASPYLPRCANLPPTCGPTGATNCCASSMVPGNAAGATLAGTTFYRSYDVATDGTYNSMASPAKVSDFQLDNYEITVGRFRQFVNAGHGTQAKPPAAGAGAHPFIANSGWDTSWNGFLATSASQLGNALMCEATRQTWTATPGANESLPINCISWFEAMAFCIWDGGFLPSEAEFNYAASGGSQHRAFPWSPSGSPGSTTIDCSYANYNPIPACANAPNRVGSQSPKGDGRWGQSDLAGNLFEWNLDWHAETLPTPCDDCANLTPGTTRVRRGGSFIFDALYSRAPERYYGLSPSSRLADLGARCARMP